MVTSIASQKGGTGKTSTTISLSAGLARKGKKVLLVDIDSQANSSKILLHNARLKSELDKIKDQYDYIFIDNTPALGWLTINSFTASDSVLVFVSPGYFELDSLVQLSKTPEEVREYFNPTLMLLGYLFTMSEPTINTSASLQILRQT
jgi:chromosome partitioning protein